MLHVCIIFPSAEDQSEVGTKNPQSLIKVFDSVFYALQCDCFGITPHFLWGFVDINVTFFYKISKELQRGKRKEKTNKNCTANVLSVEIADVCLQSKSKDSHWLFLHVSVCDWLQKFVCCFNVISKAKSTEKWTLFIQNYRYLFVLLAIFFHNVKFSQFFYCI